MDIIVIVATIWLCTSPLILWRNHRVFKFRINLLDSDFGVYKKLPSYSRMV